MDKVKLILASNHGFWGEGLLSLIKERSEDIEILTICRNIAETIAKIDQFHPDIVLLDEEIEGGDYSELAEHINEIHPEIKIIISSGYSTSSVMADYQELGFAAVLSKPYSIVNLSAVLNAVIKG